jgi:hypothetical protein
MPTMPNTKATQDATMTPFARPFFCSVLSAIVMIF